MCEPRIINLEGRITDLVEAQEIFALALRMSFGDIAVTSVCALFPYKTRDTYEETFQVIVDKCADLSYLNWLLKSSSCKCLAAT